MTTQENMATDGAITAIRFPIRLLTIALVLTTLTFAWCGWIIFDERRDSKMFQDESLRIEKLRDVIVQLDEVLTMSARMAAATGDPQWEERYRRFEPQLDAAIKETTKLGTTTLLDTKATTMTDEANIKLVEMENRALALVRAGRKEEAQAVLFSPEYEAQKKIYAEGIESFNSQVRGEMNERERQDNRLDFLLMIGALVVLAISFAAWLSVVRSLQRWRTDLEQAVSERRQAEQALRQAHDELEVRIEQRTAELGKTNQALQAEMAERKRAETASLQLAAIVESSDDSIIGKDLNSIITSWNKGAETLFGYTASELMGISIMRLIPADRQDEENQILEKIKRGEKVEPFETLRQAKDGRLIDVSVAASPIKDATGKIIGVSKVARDITARKELEAQMERLRTEHAAVLNSVGEGVHWIDVDGRIKFENPAAARMLGYEVSELIGKPAHSTMHHTRADGAAYPQSECCIYATLKDGVVRRVTDEVFWRKDGSSFPVEYICTPVYDKNGRSGGSVVIFTDITERKRAGDVLQEQARLTALEADVGSALTRGGTLAEMLRLCSEAIVRQLDAAFARIWTLNEREKMLELQASAGMYTHLNGLHGRVPVGKFKIGLIAEERKPHLTNQVVGDQRVSDQEWAKRESMIAFAGYPLLVEDRLVGVVAMFARHALTDTTLQALASISNNIAVGIERKRAEEALRESKQIIEGIINAIPVRVFWKDKNLVYMGCNAVFARYAGFADPKDIIGKDDYQLGWRDQAELYRADDRQIIESGRSKSFTEESQTTPEGDTITLLTSKIPLRGSKGEISGVLGTYVDITERKRAEEALRESEERFSGAFEHAPIGVALVLPDGRWFKVNRALCELVGYSEAELLTRTFQDITHSEDLEADLENVRRLLDGEIRSYQMEKRYVHKRGHLVTVLLDVSLVRDGQGQPRYFIAQIQDITERKRAEEALRASEEQLRAVFDLASVGIAQADPRIGRWLRVNQKMCEITGYSVGELLQMRIADITHPEDRQSDREAFERVVRGEAPDYRIEKRYIRKDGALAWVNVNMTIIRDAAGQPTRTVAAIEDITERKQIEAQLFQSQKLETVGKLAGGIAHEFNSILTAIIGQSELLLGELPAGSPLTKNAIEISKAAEQAATLTRQLLAYGRKQILQPEILDLNSVLAGMESTLRHLLGRSADVRIAPATGLKAVKADAGQIEQVIINMAMNAADAMPHGGTLTLETANVTLDQESVSRFPELKTGDYVMLAITDTGTGMTEEAKARVFEPFSSTKGVGQGTGLRLSTCYGIIKQSGGHISVYSELARGTTFKIYLPPVEQQTKMPLPRLDSPDLPRGTEAILLVEDDPALREMAATLLRRLGYTVLAAANGIEVLSPKQQRDIGHFDLLFTDVVMPHMNGKELSERVRVLSPHTRILFTSAYTENAIVHQGVLAKGVAFLQKPFTPSALAHKVREILDNGKA